MLYPRCPTCGGMLAHLEVDFEDKKKNICNNPKLTDEQKLLELKENVNNLGLLRYCCKLRVLTYIDLIDIVK
jgi:DNA-directed RNA polymerase subunit N (RpoN/RPB10)